MKTHLVIVILSLIIFPTLSQSQAVQTQPSSGIPKIQLFLNRTNQWRNYQIQFPETELKVAAPMVVAGFFCFIAASISSAGGIGGGGLFIPIMTIVAGLDLKTASGFSAFMVTGGSVANVMCNLLTTSSKFGGKTLINYDLALLLEPCMLLGVSIGVICNLVFPEWLITILFAVFLVWSTFKTCQNGLLYWKLESEMESKHGFAELENGSVREGTCKGSEGIKSAKEPLLGIEEDEKGKFPWKKMGILVMIWFSFFAIYLLRGNRYGQGIISIEPCGAEYWTLSSLQIPLAIAFTASILPSQVGFEQQLPNQQEIEDIAPVRPSSKLMFPLMALLAGILGGVFGIGGGMLISPLLLQVGIAPELAVTSMHGAGNCCNLFFHGVLLVYHVCNPVLTVGHGANRHCFHSCHHLFCWVTCWFASGTESYKQIRKGLPDCILRWYSNGFEHCFDDKLRSS